MCCMENIKKHIGHCTSFDVELLMVEALVPVYLNQAYYYLLSLPVELHINYWGRLYKTLNHLLITVL